MPGIKHGFTRISLALAVVVTAAMSLAACVGYFPAHGGVAVAIGAPPPVRAEVVVGRPGPYYVWVPGYWDWRPGYHEYVWVAGAWVRPPRAGAIWIAPRYERRHHRWTYYRGHWR